MNDGTKSRNHFLSTGKHKREAFQSCNLIENKSKSSFVAFFHIFTDNEPHLFVETLFSTSPS